MTAVMRHLQETIKITPLDKEKLIWNFRDKLKGKKKDFFIPLVKNNKYVLLDLQYSVLCTQLVHNYTRANYNQEQLKEELITALMLAELLAHLYQNYLNVPREVKRLQNEQKIYRQILQQTGIRFPDISPRDIELSNNLTQKVRGNVKKVNWPRLIIIRSKRVLDTIVPVAKEFELFCESMKTFNKYANPFFAYLGWVFFIPRLSTNLFLLFKHVLPGFWMSEEEKNLGWMARLNAQLNRRWFEIFNDIAWMTGGLLNCFVLVGALAPFGIYLNVALFAYDILLATIKAAVEIKRLQQLRNDYEKLAEKIRKEGSPEDLVEIYEYQKQLDERINYEYKKVIFGVCSTTALFVAASLALPLFAAVGIVPVISALLVLAITVTGYLVWQAIEAQEPAKEINKLAEKPSVLVTHSFFSQGAKERSKLVDSEKLDKEAEPTLDLATFSFPQF